jgi:hypothetical protein
MNAEMWVLVALMVKHFIADFPLQPMWMVKDKGFYGKAGGVAHALLHGIGTGFVLVIVGVRVPGSGDWPWWWALPFMLGDIVVHYHVDYLKMRINRVKGWGPQHPQFWNLLGLDQLAHYLTYVAIATLFIP